MLRTRLENDLKEAMRSKDRVRLQTIRSLRAALMQKEIELRTADNTEVTDQMAEAVLQKQAKQRRDSISQYETAGRDDLASIEIDELKIIESYLPEQLSDNEVRSIVGGVIEQVGASSMKDMGRVMGPAMKSLQGRADGNIVQKIRPCADCHSFDRFDETGWDYHSVEDRMAPRSIIGGLLPGHIPRY